MTSHEPNARSGARTSRTWARAARATTAAAALIAAGACEKDVGVEPTPAIVGLYELQAVGEDELAYRYAVESEGVERWLVGARLAFETNGSVAVTTVTQRRFPGGADAPVEQTSQRTYVRAGDDVTFPSSGSGVGAATGRLLEEDEALEAVGLVLPAELGAATLRFHRTQ